jgi:hypothetical protein
VSSNLLFHASDREDDIRNSIANRANRRVVFRDHDVAVARRERSNRVANWDTVVVDNCISNDASLANCRKLQRVGRLKLGYPLEDFYRQRVCGLTRARDRNCSASTAGNYRSFVRRYCYRCVSRRELDSGILDLVAERVECVDARCRAR